MGKIIFWLVVAFVVLLVVRLINARHTLQMRAQQKRETTASETTASETTVRCGHCGVFVPRSEARQVTDGFRCGNEACRHS
jgi:uncharacterized protein